MSSFEGRNVMRQRRKNIILQPVKWVVLIGVVGTVTVYGLSATGFVQWNSDKNLQNLMFWKTTQEIAPVNVPVKATPAVTAASAAPSASPSPTMTPIASLAPATPIPSSSPPAATSSRPNPANTNATSFQLLSQVQSSVAVSPNEKAWLELASAIKLEPGKLFSYNTWFTEALKSKIPEKKEDELSHIAGLLYEAVVRAGIQVGERVPHQDQPTYAASGFDVEFQPNKQDFTFYNSFDFPVTVGVIYSGETPTVTLNGSPTASWKAPKITVSKESFTPERLVLTDFTLVGKGEVRRSEGMAGTLVKVYGDMNHDGKTVLLAKDFYAPRPVVIARGPNPDELK